MSDHRCPPLQIDRKSGFCAETKTFHSLHASVSLPPLSLPLSFTSFASSFLPSPPPSHYPAYIDASSGLSISFPDLLSQVSSLSAHLLPRVSRGDVVLVLSPPALHIPVLYFALLSLGAVVSPANPLSTTHEISHLVSISKPSLAFATSSTSHKLPPELPFILLDSSDFQSLLHHGEFNTNVNPVVVQQFDPAVILYSSGTTGAVKGVVLTHRNLIAALSNHAAASTTITIPEVVMMTVPLFHVYGFIFALSTVSARKTCVVQTKRFDAKETLRAVERFGVMNLALAPPALLALVRIVEEGVVNCNLSSLQVVICGGAPISNELIRHFLRVFPNVLFGQGYGMTEAASACFRTVSEEETRSIGSVGRLTAGFEAKIVNPETGVALSPNCQGEIWIRGLQIMKGYVGDEKTSATVDSEGWLKTGDLGLINDDGFLFVGDRLKELIKCRGYQVAPMELENLLQMHQDIIEAAVVPYPDEEAGQVPIAFIVRRPGSEFNENQIKDFISEKVSPYKRIRHVFFIDSIPKNPGGKILRRNLRELASLQMASKL